MGVDVKKHKRCSVCLKCSKVKLFRLVQTTERSIKPRRLKTKRTTNRSVVTKNRRKFPPNEKEFHINLFAVTKNPIANPIDMSKRKHAQLFYFSSETFRWAAKNSRPKVSTISSQYKNPLRTQNEIDNPPLQPTKYSKRNRASAVIYFWRLGFDGTASQRNWSGWRSQTRIGTKYMYLCFVVLPSAHTRWAKMTTNATQNVNKELVCGFTHLIIS